MADELKVQYRLSYTNGSLTLPPLAETVSVDQTTQGFHGPVQIVGTSEETIAVGDVGTSGWVFLKNADATNYVQWGPDSTGMVVCGRLKPGEVAIFRLDSGTTLKAQANTANCKVQVVIFED